MSVTVYGLFGAKILTVQAETLRGADLHGAGLRRANLHKADLYGANLYGADLYGADLYGANLYGADLRWADLRGANLRWADLRWADLRGADLHKADLHWADLHGANLHGANLRGANLHEAIGAETAVARTRILPEGTLVGYKRAKDGAIVTLKIPAKAKRSHAFGRKCRAEYAKVLRIQRGTEDLGSAVSMYDSDLVYRVGETVWPDSYEEDWTVECGPGIHFYITREEAESHL